jgi:hypothetical protein
MPTKGSHASAPNFTKLCDSTELRNYVSRYSLFAGVSGNTGTANGLHARRLALVRSAGPGCGENRGLLTAEYLAT